MTVCKGCGKEIVWGETPEGKRIPLDPKPPVYFLTEDMKAIRVLPGIELGHLQIDKLAVPAYVTHFATCSQANVFSASNKERQG